MRVIAQHTLLLLAGVFSLSANSAPSAAEAAKLIAAAVSVQKFRGDRVENMLLAEPEKKAGLFVFRGEFNVARTGKKISCEDWVFSLEHKNGAWGVANIVRGRCND